MQIVHHAFLIITITFKALAIFYYTIANRLYNPCVGTQKTNVAFNFFKSIWSDIDRLPYQMICRLIKASKIVGLPNIKLQNIPIFSPAA